MVGCDSIIQDRQAETLLRFIQPRYPFFSIPHELQEELPLVTPMGNVPGVSGNEISIGPRHGNQDDELALVIARHIIGFLNVSFRGQNSGPKPLKWHDIRPNSIYEQDLIWSDPVILSNFKERQLTDCAPNGCGALETVASQIRYFQSQQTFS